MARQCLACLAQGLAATLPRNRDHFQTSCFSQGVSQCLAAPLSRVDSERFKRLLSSQFAIWLNQTPRAHVQCPTILKYTKEYGLTM